MRMLFFTTTEADYLQDSVLHGLRSLFGKDLIDYPKKNILYENSKVNDIYGKGFTLYKILDELEVDREDTEGKLKSGYFNLIIFSSIHRQEKLFNNYKKYLHKENTILLDGEDTPALFPNHRLFKKNPFILFQRKHFNRFIYFKREITDETNYYRFMKFLPINISKKMPLPSLLQTISFSIPAEKILATLPQKKKIFPKHIVDEEVAAKVEGSFTKYAFENEKDYYADLQASKYGITTKRSGWDCMRHYEIAANGAVICFRNLDKRPETCAPHGLMPGVNCISYKNYDDLLGQISKINDEKYKTLQIESFNWIKSNTTINSAKKLIDNFNLFNKS
jgi:hypothetical protein